MAASGNKPYVAVVASPGLGHITPLLEFSKRLATQHGCHVIFLEITTTTPSSPAQEQLLHDDSATLPPELHVIRLPPVHVADIVPEDAMVVTEISLIAEESLTKSLKAALNPPPKALVIDLFCTAGIDICKELSVPVYFFFTTNAALLAFSLYVPQLDSDMEGEFVDLPGPIQVPGCTPLLLENLMDQVKKRKHEEYKWYLLHCIRLRKASSIIMNTWEGLEPVSLSALRDNPFFLEIPTPPIHTIGPLIKPDDGAHAGTPSAIECLNWLDKHPPGSVLFICLGSGGSLTTEQLTELAWGLELSKQRFIWVVRPPSDLTASANFFNAGSNEVHPNTYLPKGFLERSDGIGLVVPSWAPQSAILHHSSTRVFLSHCGWNSTLESISCGVPMIAWPLYAEQRMNASILEDVGVAVWPHKSPTVVKREVVMTTVRAVMVGEQGIRLKHKANELKHSAAITLTSGGKSINTLTALSMDWK